MYSFTQSEETRRERAAKAKARREAWRAQRAAGIADDIDWQRYGKYDMFQALLRAAAAEPEAQARLCKLFVCSAA